MAKITGPLVSLGARGSLAKTAVFSSWRGRAYVRQHIIPANPKSTGQTEVRNLFSFLQQVYKRAPTLVTEVWTLAALGLPKTNRNAFTQANQKAIGKSATALTNMILSDGAKGGPPLATATATPGVGTLTIAATGPTPPTGWTLASVIAACIEDQNPQTGQLYTITALDDTTSPYSIVLTGLTSSVLYQWRAWAKWTKPDGSTAYSVQTAGTATPT